MQAQLSSGGFNVVADGASLVCREAIENQADGLAATMHQLAQQLDEVFAVQGALVRTEPELSARTYRRGSRDRLTLPRPIDDRSVPAQPPRLSMNGVGAKARFVPKQNLRPVALGLLGQRRIRVLLPQGNRLGIPLIRALQRLLRGQLQLRQQGAYRGDAQIHSELLLDQKRDDRARPQTEIQSVLTRVAAIDPAKYLSLLGRGQAARPTARASRTQCSQAVAAPSGHVHPLVDRRAIESVGPDHDTRILAFAHPPDRHETNLLQRGMVERAAINLHRTLYQQWLRQVRSIRLTYRLVSNLDGAEWRIPAPRMKMRESHIVPLARQAIAILRDLAPVTGPNGYVFPGLHDSNRPMSENA